MRPKSKEFLSKSISDISPPKEPHDTTLQEDTFPKMYVISKNFAFAAYLQKTFLEKHLSATNSDFSNLKIVFFTQLSEVIFC